MSAVTLEQLRASEAKLIRALGDPTRTVFYDEFKRENRPISEIEDALQAIRREISRLAGDGDAGSTFRVRPVRMVNGL